MTDREKWQNLIDENEKQAAQIERLESTLVALLKENQRLNALSPSGIAPADREFDSIPKGVSRMAATMRLPS